MNDFVDASKYLRHFFGWRGIVWLICGDALRKLG
jgi:hypothetical protein